MEDHKEYLLEELKQCDQKMQKLNDIQLDLIKFYFATVFTLTTIIIALINYNIYNNTGKLLTWFILFPLLLFGFVIWLSLKRILIQYEYYENIRNEISVMFLKSGSINYKFQFFPSPFKYFYSLISWLFIINLFAFLYKAIPFLGKTKMPTLIISSIAILFTILLFSLATVALNNARKKSRDAKRISDIKQVMTALELYYNDHNNKYPIAKNMDGLATELSRRELVYMSNLPVDPLNNEEYNYSYNCEDGKNYQLKYKLEEGGEKIATPTGVGL